MSLPDLITVSRATQNAALSALNASNASYLASLITTASDAIRRACNRDVSQTSYTEYYSGSGSSGTVEPLRLRQFPVAEITRVATSPRAALHVQNTDGITNQRATVETTPTALRLLRVASATPVTIDLPFATYPTLASLASAANAQGAGWNATIVGGFANWPSADLKPLQGAASALFGGRDLEIYTEDLEPYLTWPPGDPTGDDNWGFCGWRLDDETGELFGRFPRGQLNVRIDYTAGFATIPQPVQEACVQLVQDLYNAGLVNNTLKKATLGAGSFELKNQTKAAVLSGKVSMLLAPYVDHSKMISRR